MALVDPDVPAVPVLVPLLVRPDAADVPDDDPGLPAVVVPEAPDDAAAPD